MTTRSLLHHTTHTHSFSAHQTRHSTRLCVPRQADRRSSQQHRCPPCRALDIDWSDPDTLIGVAGAFLGVGLGIGVPVFYLSRDAKDKEKLEYVREMNRKRFEETGEYMTDDEIRAIRTPKWTDRREFADDD